MITVTYTLYIGEFFEEQDEINIVCALNGSHFAIFMTHPAPLSPDVPDSNEFLAEFKCENEIPANCLDELDAEKFGLRMLQLKNEPLGTYCKCGCRENLYWVHNYDGWEYITTRCKTCLVEKYNLGKEINMISPSATISYKDDDYIYFEDTYSTQDFIRQLLHPKSRVMGPHKLLMEKATLFKCCACRRIRSMVDLCCAECQTAFDKISLVTNIIRQYPLVSDIWTTIIYMFILPKEMMNGESTLTGFSAGLLDSNDMGVC